MRHLLLLISISIVAGRQQSLAQIDKTVQYSYTVLYDYIMQPNKDDKDRKITEVMLLQAGEQHSYFLSYNHYRTDSMIKVQAELAEKTGYATMPPATARPPQPRVMYKILKEHSTKQLFFASKFVIHTAHYQDALPTLQWEMEQEEKIIAGYTCKKATTSFAGRNYIAWYATEIPIADGPYKFHGLPGLILSISDTEDHHVFTATSVTKESQTIALKKWEGRYVHAMADKNEFLAYVQKMENDPALMFKQEMIAVPDYMIQEQVDKIKEAQKLSNNKIER